MAGENSNRASSIVVLVLMFAVCLHDVNAILKTIFVEDVCHLKNEHLLSLKDLNSGILMATSSDEPIDCTVTLYPQYGFSIVLSIYRYDLEPQDLLTIEDSDHHKFSLIGWKEFKDERKSIISDGKMTIHFKRGNYTVGYPKQRFQFTFTQVGEAPCFPNEFKCKNEKCVLKTLVCDGHNHCGDRSDQMNCVPEEEEKVMNMNKTIYEVKDQSPIWIITIIVASLILLIVIIVFVAVVVRNERRKKANASNKNPEAQVSGNNGQQSNGSSVPRNPEPLSARNLQSSANTEFQQGHPQRPTIFTQIRRSLRGQRSQNVEEQPKEQLSNSYQVPSLYPNLDHLPSAPELEGVHNPNFKSEE